jgi:DNA-binding MarR family transcriptional regulator
MASRLPATSAREREENLAILLRAPFMRMTDLLYERFAERGLGDFGVAHGAVFQFLDDAGTQVSELARRAQLTKQSMAKLVAHLEQRGYVERVPHPDDGRAKLVRATRRGREVYAVARELTAELEAGLKRRLGAARLKELRVLLAELDAALPRRDDLM